MNTSRYFRALACAATAAFSGAVYAAEPPSLIDAADYLTQHGMDKSAAQSFIKDASGSDRVRMISPDTLSGLVMSLRLAGAEGGPAFMAFSREIIQSQRDSGDAAYAIPVRDPAVRAFLKADCLVKTVSEPFNAKQMVGQMLQSPATTIENAVFSDDELAVVLIGHEMSHCAPGNIAAHATMKEVDADIHLAEMPQHKPLQKDTIDKLALVRVMGDMCNRSGYVPTGHSTGLFLDAKARGKSMTWEEASPVYGELLPLLKSFRDAQGKEVMNNVPCFVATGAAYKIFLEDNAGRFKPLTRHYMDMTIRGVQAFAPVALDRAVQELRTRPVAVLKAP